jgi:hypothetical protein
MQEAFQALGDLNEQTEFGYTGDRAGIVGADVETVGDVVPGAFFQALEAEVDLFLLEVDLDDLGRAFLPDLEGF